jgi:glucose-1-phosphate cytidylyltransferase
MKTVILAGGLGTRLSEETRYKPKPLVSIGRFPILWHLLKIYEFYNQNEFIIAGGYKQNHIKNFLLKNNNLNSKIDLIDTGSDTNTGGRLFRLKKFLKNNTFMLTYGDGLANININKLINFHKKHKSLATITVVRPPARWGSVKITNNTVNKFEEKNQLNEGWINGGFFIFEPEIFNYIKNGDSTILEYDVLPILAKKKYLKAYKHQGFWQCMDNLRDKKNLEKLWNQKNPPWKIWK